MGSASSVSSGCPANNDMITTAIIKKKRFMMVSGDAVK